MNKHNYIKSIQKRILIALSIMAMGISIAGCGSTEPDMTDDANTASIGAFTLSAINASTLNIAWQNPALSDPFTVSVQLRHVPTQTDLIEVLSLTDTDYPEVQISSLIPEDDYEGKIEVTLMDGTLVESGVEMITMPRVQTGLYSSPNYTNFSTDILTSTFEWDWNHPALPDGLLTDIRIQRRVSSSLLWQTVGTVGITDEIFQDASLQLDHMNQYEYRMISSFDDGTVSESLVTNIFTLATQLPAIDSLTINLTNAQFHLDGFLEDNVIGLLPFTVEIGLDLPYTFEDIVAKIGNIQIKPHYHVVNNVTLDQTITPVHGAIRNYGSETDSFISSVQFENEFGLTFSMGEYVPEWSNYTVEFHAEATPVDPSFTGMNYTGVTDMLQCYSYNCVNTF